MADSHRLSRRTLLHGVGATVALPWLEAMFASANTPTPGTETAATGEAVVGQPPVRLAYFYVPNGVHMPAWRPPAEGALNELSPIMQPLEPVKDQVTVLSNLEAEHCDGNTAAHEPAGGGFLVGKKCKHSETPEVGGVSVDQWAAQQVGHLTPVDSLALGIDPGHRGDHGYSGTYMSHISWRSKTTPAALELNPKQLFQRLFQDQPPRKPDWNQQASLPQPPPDSVEASILDLVQEETRSLQRKLGFQDRRRLEEYLDGVRNIEKRIALAAADEHAHHQDNFVDRPDVDDPTSPELIIPEGRGIPSVYADHVNLMLDILTLAFQTDTTRVASFMFSYEKSGRSYAEVDAPGSHHSTSHHQGKAKNHKELTNINTHHMALFARMLERMSRIEEGDRTLLDNVMILYGSGISDGNRHNHDDLPILVAGGGGSTLRGNQHIAYAKKTPLCNLYLEMLQRAGIPRDKFGDSTGRLSELG